MKLNSQNSDLRRRAGRLLFLFGLSAFWSAALHLNLAAAQTSNDAAPSRDPAAIETLQSALNAMGGTATWVSLHTAVTTGSLTAPNKASASAFTWTDDWTAGIRMRRDNTREDGSHHVLVQGAAADIPSPPSSPSNPALPNVHPPRFDKVTALIFHLPGAALSIVLQDQRYSISTTTLPGRPSFFQGAPYRTDPSLPNLSNTSCVHIMRTPRDGGDSAASLTLCFSNTSNLPVYARVMQPNIFDPTKPLAETAEYSAFKKMGPALVPSTVSIIDPLNRRKILTVNSVSWNSSLSSSAFSGASQ